MIPVRLQVHGFLSYKEQIELSFENFDLACISGDNGAGKSSLLDAITWVLFGKARRNDDGVINNTCTEAEVIFQFLYENELYRVQRLKARNRSVLLEFQIKDDAGTWKALTECSVAETQEWINRTLHLDYDTFINASFFLQGKADEFTQKNSTQRKEILAGILGMDVWEHYKDITREARRTLESRMKMIEGSLHEIEEELVREEQRRQALEQAKAELQEAERQRREQQKLYDQAKSLAELIAEQQKHIDELKERRNVVQTSVQRFEQHMKERLDDEQNLVQVVDAAKEIEKTFQERVVLKEKLQELDALSSRFYALQQKQAEAAQSIAVEESRLKQELFSLENERSKIQQMIENSLELEKEKTRLSNELLQLQTEVEQLGAIKTQLDDCVVKKSALQAENATLRAHMQKLKERMERLKAETGSTCPLCGQPLSEEHRRQVVDEIHAEGKQDAENFRKNEELLSKLGDEIITCEKQIVALNDQTQRLRTKEREFGALESELKRLALEIASWKSDGAPKIKALEERLKERKFAQGVRDQETAISLEMEKLGYDAALHESYRKREQASRDAEQKHQAALIAASRLEALRGEIAILRSQHQAGLDEIEMLNSKLETLENQHQQAASQAPDLDEVEGHLKELIAMENQQRTVVGGAMQLLAVIETQKERKQKIHDDLADLSREQTNFLLLEKAFGRDGVQTLIMEEALPQMQAQANDILRKLSSGSMSVRFETEREYKDKKRDDKMQVLDILISDAEGVQRPYDLFSGGEAFRINFAIRLALSKVLAQRAGARLQMLVIDEGFGSQDAEGRQKLIEAINLIRPDFKKILVITHLEELKDAFPARIEVSKTRKGSQVEVIVQ